MKTRSVDALSKSPPVNALSNGPPVDALNKSPPVDALNKSPPVDALSKSPTNVNGPKAETPIWPKWASGRNLIGQMMRHNNTIRQPGPSEKGKTFLDTAYMSLEKKKSAASLEASNEKPRRWGCCRISIVLISLVFLVALVVTVVYVLFCTDVVKYLTGTANRTGQLSRDDEHALLNSTEQHGLDPSQHGGGLGSTVQQQQQQHHQHDPNVEPATTTPTPQRVLQILVLVVDTRSHNVDGSAFKNTLDAWRKTELAWREMQANDAISDRLTVRHCQECTAVGLRDDARGKTIFYTVQYAKGETHGFNTVVFVAQPTPPGEVLATLTRYGRTNSLGDICQQNTWSTTGCDFVVGGRAESKDALKDRIAPPDTETSTGKSAEDPKMRSSPQFSFHVQAIQSSEHELLRYDKTIIMQKHGNKFKVLIHRPMAVK